MRSGDCDVLIIGSGAAGLTAALAASVAGQRVRIIEKEPLVGGTTALSEGMIWVPLSAAARRKGIADTREAALTYLTAAAAPHVEPKRLAAYIDAATAMLDFVEAHSDARFTLSTHSIDYHQNLPGATKGARAFNPGIFDGRKLAADFDRLRPPLSSTMLLGGMTVASHDLPHFLAMTRSPRSALTVAGIVARYGRDRLFGFRRGTRIANGNGLVGALMAALKERGIAIETGVRARELWLEDGRVSGAGLDTPRGAEAVKARCVLLACGGFSGSAPLRQCHYPHVAQGGAHHSLAPHSNTGDGLELALKVGGALNTDLAQSAAWTPVSLVPQSDGSLVPFPHYVDRGKPGVIAITHHGCRFTNEADSYHRFVPAMIHALANQPDGAIWIMADHRALRRYGIGAVPPAPARFAPFLRNGYLRTGGTLADLARNTGIDLDGLTRALATFNANADKGEDPEFGKGASAYNRANGDANHRPNPCLAPLINPPFYAVRIFPGDIATFVGLRTDEHARVCNASGEPIAGLYAAGNDAASAMGGDYPAAGITIGSAMTFGFIAARHIASCR
jgi:glycine/D-amino acid oxidase-like deaminating enzyme